MLQMEHLMDRKPSQLSGGQRQRVAIAEDKIYAPGTEIGLHFDPARAHLFAPE